MAGGLKIFVPFAILSGVPLFGTALAQNRDIYGLTDLKPYKGPVATRPATNDLQRIISSKEALPKAYGKPIGDPVFTIHAVGGVMVDSTFKR